jgi:hypothetical protein
MAKTKKPDPKKQTHIYLDAEMWSELERMARAENRSVTGQIRALIKEAIKDRAEQPA